MEAKPAVTVDEGSLATLPDPPARSFVGKVKRGVRALGTKDAWFGDHNYVALFTPTVPFLCKPDTTSLPFYSVNARLPIFLAFLLGSPTRARDARWSCDPSAANRQLQRR